MRNPDSEGPPNPFYSRAPAVTSEPRVEVVEGRDASGSCAPCCSSSAGSSWGGGSVLSGSGLHAPEMLCLGTLPTVYSSFLRLPALC